VRSTIEAVLNDIQQAATCCARASERFDNWVAARLPPVAGADRRPDCQPAEQVISDIQFASADQALRRAQRRALLDIEVETLPG